MFDLLTLAFQTDPTRVITFLLGIEQSPRTYRGDRHHRSASWPDAPQRRQGEDRKGHADQRLSHQAVHLSPRQAEGDEGRRRHAAGPLDDRLRQRSCRRQPHQHDNLPTSSPAAAMARSSRAVMVRYADETPITNLYVAMLDRWACRVETLGDSTGNWAISRISERALKSA